MTRGRSSSNTPKSSIGGRVSGMSNRSGARTPISEDGSEDGKKVPPAKLLERRLSETRSDTMESVQAERGSMVEGQGR